MGNSLIIHGITKIIDEGWKNNETDDGNHHKTKVLEIQSNNNKFYLMLFTKRAKKVDNLIKIDNKIINNEVVENIYEK